VRLWNGFEAVLGDEPRVTFTIPSVASLRQLIRPSLDRLGTAYVEGMLEVEGKLADILQVAIRLAAHSAPRTRRGPRMFRHTRAADAEAIRYHYDVSNQFYALWLDTNMVYSCAYFRSPRIAWRLHKSEDRSYPGQAAREAGRPPARHRMRLGSVGHAGRGKVRRQGSRRHAVAEPIRAGARADRRGGPGGPVRVRLEDYRDVTGKFDRIASVGMFEHVGLQHLREYFAKIRSLLQTRARDESWNHDR